jgi:hypothetical protein
MITFTAFAYRLSARAQQRVDLAHQRARDESEQGEIVEKVIIVAAAAGIAIAAMAAIALAVTGKLGNLNL